MSKIQASAKIVIPNGKLEEFKQAAIEYIKEVKEKDKGTLQSEWFISHDNSECEIRETWESSDAVLEHQANLAEFSMKFFEKFAAPYLVTIYGNPTPELLQKARSGGGTVDVKVYSFLAGLESNWYVIP
jgi:quinol monooxygenase YgiN